MSIKNLLDSTHKAHMDIYVDSLDATNIIVSDDVDIGGDLDVTGTATIGTVVLPTTIETDQIDEQSTGVGVSIGHILKTTAGMNMNTMTVSKILGTDASKDVESIDIHNFIAGTTDQIVVANDGDGSCTLSTPQSINTTSSVQFVDADLTSLSISGATATRLLATDGTKEVVSSDLYAWVTQTTDQVLIADDGDGTISFSLPQSINTTSSVEFVDADLTSLSISGSTATRLLATDGTKEVVSSDLYAWVTQTTDQVLIADDGDGTISFSLPQDIATTSAVEFGSVKVTAQPMFIASANAQSNVTGDGTAYTVLWANEIVDIGSNFASNTFTAPVTGIYEFNLTLSIKDFSADNTHMLCTLVTTGATYELASCNPYVCMEVGEDLTFSASIMSQMSATNTAYVVLQCNGTTKEIDVDPSHFSGKLITAT
jgi:hypothetical protein